MTRAGKTRRRALHTIIASAVLVLIIALGWLSQGCPVFSAGAAFRQAFQNAALSAPKLEQLYDLENSYDATYYYALAESGGTAYLAVLQKNGAAWYPYQSSNSFGVQTNPSADGICYMPLKNLPFKKDNYNLSTPFGIYNIGPVFAVKTGGARAELKLVLEATTLRSDQVNYNEHSVCAGGVFPLLAAEAENGWTCFCFDEEPVDDLHAHIYYETDPDVWASFEGNEAAYNYYEWVRSYMDNRELRYLARYQPARFALTLYDEAGNVTKTVTWAP